MSLVTLNADNATYGAGNFWVFNNTWGKKALVNGVDYTESITSDTSTFPNSITMSWNWPVASSVLAYPEIIYGASPFQPAPSGVVLPASTQVADFANLSTQYSFSLTGQTNNFDVTFDIWLTSQPDGGRDTRTDELMIVVHNPWNWGKGETPDFSTGGINVWDSGTQSDGTLSWEMLSAIAPADMLSGNISISDIIKGLIWNGTLTGNEYISGIEVGAEVGGGTGSLTINNLSYQWDAKPTVQLTAGNDSFNIAAAGGNHIVGNGGIDTVVYNDTYSHFQLKSSGADLLLMQNNNISTLDVLDGITYVKFSDGTYNVTTSIFTYNVPKITSFSPDSNVIGDGITNANHVTLSGTAAAGSAVQVYDGATLLGTATANATGAWSFATATLTDGVHSFTSMSVDAAGNISAPSPVLSVTVDTVAPAAPVIVGDTMTNTNQVILTGTAEANSTVSVFEGTTQLGAATVNASGTWSFTTAALATGSHTFSATATDAAGNTSLASEYLDPIIPPSAPKISSFSPDSNIVGDGITNANHVTLSGIADANTTVNIFDGTTQLGTATVNGSGAWSFATGQLADGTHNFTATDMDAAGDASAASSVLSVVVDTKAPAVTESLAHDTGASSTDKITSNSALIGSGDPNAVVTLKEGSIILGTTTADASGHWTFAPVGLLDGSHTILASETDAAGNTATTSLTFALDTHAPVPTITNELLGPAGKLTLSGTTAEANDTVSVYDGSTLLGTTKTDINGAWSFLAGKVSNAVHTYTVNATDIAGNTGHSSNGAILGSSSADTLVGTSGNDIIIGNGGNDTFVGGGGADLLTAGSGKDSFLFKAISDSTPASHDTIVNFNHTYDTINFTNISGINATNGIPTFQGQLTGSGNLTLNAHSIGYIEVGGNTEVLVNTSNSAETVTTLDSHAANMEIVLAGIHLGLTQSTFHLI
jgi:Bacterial Ig-like domain/RTX calcium-binding nonapeptide repeat (4 copies)/Glycosyl hydrolase family 12